MYFICFIIILVIITIIMRTLRRKFVWVDKAWWGIVFGLPIVIWVINGFWSAVLALFVLLFIGEFVFQISKRKRFFNGNDGYWDVTCPKCGYHELVTLEEQINWDDNSISLKIRCVRCNEVSSIRLKNFQ